MFARSLILLSLLASTGCSNPAWTPPPGASPRVILREAEADARAGRYEVALAKHLWYHENALRLEPSQAGVRLSFALSYWLDLAENYPPALDALKGIRDEAESQVLAATPVGNPFFDFAAINESLNETDRTVRLFQHLDKENPREARKMFRRAEPALIEAKQYLLCGKYIDGKNDFKREAEMFQRLAGGDDVSQQDERIRRQADFARHSFSNRVATLVALLVLNGRDKEAAEIAAEAKTTLPDESFAAKLDESLQGVVPVPWP